MSIGAEPNLNAYVNQMQSAEASKKEHDIKRWAREWETAKWREEEKPKTRTKRFLEEEAF